MLNAVNFWKTFLRVVGRGAGAREAKLTDKMKNVSSEILIIQFQIWAAKYVFLDLFDFQKRNKPENIRVKFKKILVKNFAA